MPIFNESISSVKKYFEEQLLKQILGFNMAAFPTSLQHHKDEVADTGHAAHIYQFSGF